MATPLSETGGLLCFLQHRKAILALRDLIAGGHGVERPFLHFFGKEKDRLLFSIFQGGLAGMQVVGAAFAVRVRVCAHVIISFAMYIDGQTLLHIDPPVENPSVETVRLQTCSSDKPLNLWRYCITTFPERKYPWTGEIRREASEILSIHITRPATGRRSPARIAHTPLDGRDTGRFPPDRSARPGVSGRQFRRRIR